MTDCFFNISNGSITNRATIKKCFDSLKDGRYYLKIEKKNNRTSLQNRYLHGVVIPLVFQGLRDAGFNDVKDNEDAKIVIKTLFLKRKIRNELTDEVIEVVRRTRDLTTVEMTNFIDEVIQWGVQYLGITIPAPGEQLVMYEEVSK